MNDSDSTRAHVNRRRDYIPAGPQEEFIVPLLQDRICAALAAYAAPKRGGGRALDVGCGRQPFRSDLEALGYEYESVDVQQNPEGTVDYVAALDQDLPEELTGQRRYDFLLCTEVLEHVANWPHAFENLNRLLAPGGRLLVTCPHFYHLHEIPYDYWRPTPFAIKYFSALVGLSVLACEQVGTAWDVLGTALANCRVAPAGVRWAHRPLAWLSRPVLGLIQVLLRRRVLQRMVALNSPLYLANVAVLEKPAL